jgi:hypothetical protein
VDAETLRYVTDSHPPFIGISLEKGKESGKHSKEQQKYKMALQKSKMALHMCLYNYNL